MRDATELLRDVERRLREAVHEDEYGNDYVNVDEITDVIDIIDRARLTGEVTWPREAL